MRRDLGQRDGGLRAVVHPAQGDAAGGELLLADDHRERGARTSAILSWAFSGRSSYAAVGADPRASAAPRRSAGPPLRAVRRSPPRSSASARSAGGATPSSSMRQQHPLQAHARTRPRAWAGRRAPRRARRTGRRRASTARVAAFSAAHRRRTRTRCACSSRGPARARGDACSRPRRRVSAGAHGGEVLVAGLAQVVGDRGASSTKAFSPSTLQSSTRSGLSPGGPGSPRPARPRAGQVGDQRRAVGRPAHLVADEFRCSSVARNPSRPQVTRRRARSPRRRRRARRSPNTSTPNCRSSRSRPAWGRPWRYSADVVGLERRPEILPSCR